MSQLKIKAAKAALDYLDDNSILGIGTGTTVNYFIEQLATIKHRIDACVASSEDTAKRLRSYNIPVVDLNTLSELPLYIDGADEVNIRGEMIKGGGGALTREKIIATVARKFICIVDESKLVKQLGAFPIAVEVLPLARSFVARELLKLGGSPNYRNQCLTDNGNHILDVYHLDLSQPYHLEETIKMIPGVVESGLFIKRTADIVLAANEKEVVIIKK